MSNDRAQKYNKIGEDKSMSWNSKYIIRKKRYTFRELHVIKCQVTFIMVLKLAADGVPGNESVEDNETR